MAAYNGFGSKLDQVVNSLVAASSHLSHAQAELDKCMIWDQAADV